MTTVIKCEDLPKKDRLSHSDGYVKVFLIPGKSRKQKTKVVKKENNPEFNETFSFVVISFFKSIFQLKDIFETSAVNLKQKVRYW